MQKIVLVTIILFMLVNILFFSHLADARRVKNENSRADYSHLLTVLIDPRKLFSNYEIDIDGQNLDIWNIFSKAERLEFFDTLMFLVLKDTLDLSNLDLIKEFVLNGEIPAIKCTIDMINATGLTTTMETEISPGKIDQWLQREKTNSITLLENMANGTLFTLDELAMYIDEYMAFHGRPFIRSSDYVYNVLESTVDWIMNPLAFLLLVQKYIFDDTTQDPF